MGITLLPNYIRIIHGGKGGSYCGKRQSRESVRDDVVQGDRIIRILSHFSVTVGSIEKAGADPYRNMFILLIYFIRIDEIVLLASASIHVRINYALHMTLYPFRTLYSVHTPEGDEGKKGPSAN